MKKEDKTLVQTFHVDFNPEDHDFCVCEHHKSKHAYVPPSRPHPGWGVGACDQCSCPQFICEVCIKILR